MSDRELTACFTKCQDPLPVEAGTVLISVLAFISLFAYSFVLLCFFFLFFFMFNWNITFFYSDQVSLQKQ